MRHAPIIDYISISVPVPNLLDQYERSLQNDTAFTNEPRIWQLCDLLYNQVQWTTYDKRGIFKRQIHFEEFGMSYFDGHSTVTLIQFSGKGCDSLRKLGIMEKFICDWQNRITRLDIAADFTTDVSPDEAIQNRTNRRIKDGNRYPSESGLTCYVGSRDSDRFARVYRYSPPHPRSGTLRLEYQLSDEQAKLAATELTKTSVISIFDRLGTTFGWTHKVFLQPDALPKLPSAQRTGSKGGTVHWLFSDVVGAVQKIADKGDLDLLIAFRDQICAIIEEQYASSKGDLP